ncbi:MAG TPA: Gfo/Idh/MocA family oxidoreductase [Chthoniobacteraceae bacterium]|nr:Gfo/Idh/MocA family oxidoreductase [Chthoniobacteraceae bacterium]
MRTSQAPDSKKSGTARLPRIGFLGAGWIGRRRMEAIWRAGVAEVVAIADPSAECVDECMQWVPDAQRHETFDELLNVSLDGLVISTPSALHAEQSIAALQRGLGVFCQKPLGRNTEEVQSIIASARRADRLLAVDLSYRHIAGLQRIRELIRGGALGEIFAVDLVFHNAFGPQAAWFYDAQLSGGGCVVDLGIHLVDAALWILDAAVVGVSSRVLAKGHPLAMKPEAVEDFATARLDLVSGAVVTLACSWRLHAGRDAVIEMSFYGTEGGAALRNVNGSFHDFRAEHYRGTTTELLAEPPDAWGGRAAVAWAERLAAANVFDPDVERQIEVALALDAIYGRENAASLVAQGAAR